MFYVAFIFANIKNLHYRPNPTCLLVIPGKAMRLGKTLGEVDLVLHWRRGWFSVYGVCVCSHICLEDGVRMGLYAWYGKDGVEF